MWTEKPAAGVTQRGQGTFRDRNNQDEDAKGVNHDQESSALPFSSAPLSEKPKRFQPCQAL